MSTRTCCIAMSILISSGSATAAILQVPTQYPTISNAIDGAHDGDVINLAAGWYAECIDYQGKSIRITGPAAGNAAVISGWGLNDAVVTFDDGEGPGAVLENVTVAYGNVADWAQTGWQNGGGIWIHKSSPRIINCWITRNGAVQGGGLCVYQGSPYIERCRFDSNSAEDSGGGMYCNESNPVVISCIFENNRAERGGGGVMSEEFSDIEVRNCEFQNNHVSGGIPPFGVEGLAGGGGMMTSHGSAQVVNCQFLKNGGLYGGGFRNQSGVALVEDCEFMDNSAEYYGGGLMSNSTYSDTSIEVLNCFFKVNQSLKGGGAWIHDANPNAGLVCKASFEQCHLEGNTGLYGGGLAAKSSEISLVESYFVANISSSTAGQVSSRGGGVYALETTLEMDNVVFRENLSFLGGGVWHVEGDLDMSVCTFINNLSYNGGGGMYTRESTCKDQGSTFDQNNPWNGVGGGWLIVQCKVEAIETEFKSQYASLVGAGVAATDSELLFDSALFQGNSAQHPGGGIWISKSTSTFQSCEFSENDSHTKGGAGAFIGGDAQFYDTKFDYNIAQEGGGLFLDGTDADIEGCSFTSNMALDLGYDVFGTISNGFTGGAIHTNQPAWIKNTFFCANTPNHVEGPWFNLLGNTMSDNCLQCPWDINGDGMVDIDDLMDAWTAMVANQCSNCDVNGDGVDNVLDLIDIINHFGPC